MNHQVDGRKLGRNTSHRRALFRNLANALIEQERIVTTVAKAKEAKRFVEKLITLAKKNTVAARRLAFARTRCQESVEKLFSTLLERYQQRPGGYTRVIRLSERRRGDAAQMAAFELVDHPLIDRKRKPKDQKLPAADSQAPQAHDPFKRFRKLFRSKKTTQETQSS